MEKMSLQIQMMVVGNSLNSFPDSRFEEELPLLRLTCDV